MARERRPRNLQTARRGPQQLADRQERLLPLPRSTARLVQRHRREANGGLLFDKYMKLAPSRFDQRIQREIIRFAAEDAKAAWERLAWERIIERHRVLLRDLGAQSFVAATSSPLCLHLSRTTSLENGGIALHPVWGTPYIPGTALKGMTRRYAENIWKPRQPDRAQAQALIDAIFGTVPTGQGDGASNAAAGNVVFVEAWPVNLRQIQLDIVNTHYPHYYQGNDPPGDWDQPQPVYFPAVPAGTEFLFGVAPRHPAVPQQHVELARQWLIEALAHLGVGAKTASGYGRMDTEASSVAAPVDLASEKLASMELELMLVSPAFLGGAEPSDPAGCDLRGNSLRGLLRWWWRTLHAGYLTRQQLKALESSIWGSVELASPISLRIERVDVPDPELFDRAAIVRQYELESPKPGEQPGLAYITYGLAEQANRRRWYLPSGARWRIIALAQPTSFEAATLRRRWQLSATDVLEQFKLALWLLATYGGIGAKARKGFGSLACAEPLADLSLESAGELAARLRRQCGFPPRHYDDAKVQSASFAAALRSEPPLAPVTVPLGKNQVWAALNSLGDRMRRFARSIPKDERRGLGMPRKLVVRGDLLFHPGKHVQRTRRHAAPVCFHLNQTPEGYSVTASFFPAPELPSLPASRGLLQKYRNYLLGLAAGTQEQTD